MDYFPKSIIDPLLLHPGTLLEATCELIGVELVRGKESIIYAKQVFMYLDVQPSRRGVGHYRFKLLSNEYVFVEATIGQFKRWFKIFKKTVRQQ